MALGACVLLLTAVTLLACHPRAPTGPLVLIVIDTLPAKRLGAYGYERPTSPNLDRWVSSGRLYHYALAPAPWTLPSFGSIFTGQLPSRHGAGRYRSTTDEKPKPAAFEGLAENVQTLAEVLKQNGFRTGAVMGNPVLGPEFGFDRGFDSYDYVMGGNEQIRSAAEVVERALGWIDSQETERLFLAVHVFEPHINYDAPSPFNGRFSANYPSRLKIPVDGKSWRSTNSSLPRADRDFVEAAYDEEVAYVDQEVGRMLDGLAERGVLDRGLVVLTSDHGEEFWEHNLWEHGHAMWQEVLQVPLIFWGSAVRSGREEAPVSLVDIVPTVLEAYSVSVDHAMEGRSIWKNLSRGSALEKRRLYAEGILYGGEKKAVVSWPYKLVVNQYDGKVQLFDLEADPQEQRDLSAVKVDIKDRLLRDLEVHFREASAAAGAAIPAELSVEARKKLKALGYLE